MDYSILNEKELFFGYFREKYQLIYNSNVFYRDLQFAVISYFKRKDVKIGLNDAAEILKEFIVQLENDEQFIKVAHHTWKVNFQPDDVVNH